MENDFIDPPEMSDDEAALVEALNPLLPPGAEKTLHQLYDSGGGLTRSDGPRPAETDWTDPKVNDLLAPAAVDPDDFSDARNNNLLKKEF